MTKFQQRRDRLKKLIKQAEADGMLVSDGANITYLTGFTGDDSMLLVSKHDSLMLSDARYTTQLEEECPDLKLAIRQTGQTFKSLLGKQLASLKLTNPVFESQHVSVALADQLQSAADKVVWHPTEGLVEQLREIKDREEVSKIRDAVRIAERTFAVIRASLQGDQTEKELGDLLEHQIRLLGGRGCSFTPIVAVGDRAALAHYRPGGRKVAEDPLLLIDWGAIGGDGYVSDLTRVLITGKASAKARRVYETVLAAQQAAIAAIKPGVALHDIDQTARQVIEDAGFGRRFGHSLGHGIGLEVHEQPRVAQKQQRELKPGMVITIEPGIYLPGWGGVRIEDDVLVTRSGHEVLSSVPKEFETAMVQL